MKELLVLATVFIFLVCEVNANDYPSDCNRFTNDHGYCKFDDETDYGCLPSTLYIYIYILNHSFRVYIYR